ncbi:MULTISPECIES: hypothetical protein [Aeromicrobium]|uniref:hypothetical protein n=1 Tax=Aeromicrobium TaxID=2040 RepID=UPI00257C5E8D|nr:MULTISPECIES: hypothetical protein [Aeromicrobium]
MNGVKEASVTVAAFAIEVAFIFHVTETGPLGELGGPASVILWVLALIVVPFVLPELWRSSNDQPEE